MLLAGRAAGWLKPGEPLDFFDLKRVVEDLLAGFGVEAAFVRGPEAAAVALPFCTPGWRRRCRCRAARRLGLAGELHPAAARRLGLEVRGPLRRARRWRPWPPAGRRSRSVPPPRFPASTRDLSFWVDAAVPAAAQRAAFLAAGEPLLRELAVLEDFRDPRYAPAGKKGMLWTHDVPR